MGDSTVVFGAGESRTGALSLAPILRLHRHSAGYVTFSAGADDDFHYRVAIRGDELNSCFPALLDELLKDFYVSINAGYRLSRYGPHGSAYGHPKHDSAHLRYLCACYADL